MPISLVRVLTEKARTAAMPIDATMSYQPNGFTLTPIEKIAATLSSEPIAATPSLYYVKTFGLDAEIE